MDKKEFRRKLTSLVLPITFQQFILAVVSASDAPDGGSDRPGSPISSIPGRSDHFCV